MNNYSYLTDAELMRHAANLRFPSGLELELAERLRRALAEVDDLRREVESLVPPDGDAE